MGRMVAELVVDAGLGVATPHAAILGVRVLAQAAVLPAVGAVVEGHCVVRVEEVGVEGIVVEEGVGVGLGGGGRRW